MENIIGLGKIEALADQEGKGSIWRACLACQRSTKDKSFGKNIIKLAESYCNGNNKALKELKDVYSQSIKGSSGEFQQALIALKNAVGDAPKEIDTRADLWLRLNRLIST